MALKQHLARQIVQDFQGLEASLKAETDWSRQFQQRESPEAIDIVEVRVNDIGQLAPHLHETPWLIKVDKLIQKAGLASSVTEGQRKREQGAVRIAGDVVKDPFLPIGLPPQVIDVRVGRTMKRVHIVL